MKDLKAIPNPENELSTIPADAHSLEVFHLAYDEDNPAKRRAYIGYKIPNGNFHFTNVPYTGL